MNDKELEVTRLSERKIRTPLEFSDQSKAKKFDKAIRDDTYIGPVYTSDTPEPYVTLAVPLRAPSREIVGVVSAEANLKFLSEVIGNIHFGVAGYAYLTDGQGDLMAHKGPSLCIKRTKANKT